MLEPSDTPQPDVPLLKNRDFLLFVICRSFNVVSVHALTVAVGWHVYQISSDPFDLGLIGLAQFAPAFILFLLAGIVADRYQRKRIMVFCNFLHIIAVSLIAALFWYDNVSNLFGGLCPCP